MYSSDDSTRILRIAAWIWLGYLLALALMDLALYAPLIQRLLAGGARFDPNLQNQLVQPRSPLLSVYLFYIANGLVAFSFLLLANWNLAREKLAALHYPLMVLIISAAPILINMLVVPRFPQGPLSNAEGMALRQLPVLFVALALVAWQYHLSQVVFFALATTALELGLILFQAFEYRNIFVFIFVAIIRTITFIAVGIFISTLVTRLRRQQESLREANANLTHYASTLEQLAVSRERNRLARELHDTLAHSLTALSVSLETVKAYFDIDREKTRAMIDTSLEATRKGVDETRRALKALRSSDLEDLGLRLAIKKIAESAAARFALDLELDLQDPMPSLSPDIEQTVFRIAQEAIENITKHAQAQKFRIKLMHDGKLTLTIQDDGIGFDANSKTASGHFGLVGMRERAALAGGQFKIESKHGKGTRVELTI